VLRSLESGCHAGEEVVDVPAQIGGYISFEGQTGARTRSSRPAPNAQEQAIIQEQEPRQATVATVLQPLIETEFFLFTQDPRKLHTRRRLVDLNLSYFQIPSSAYSRIPYESDYRLTPARPEGTLVAFGG
jgi:hypothetical protein